MSTPFKLDEGYSEETRSQPDCDDAATPSASQGQAADALLATPELGLPSWVSSLDEAERSGRLTRTPTGTL